MLASLLWHEGSVAYFFNALVSKDRRFLGYFLCIKHGLSVFLKRQLGLVRKEVVQFIYLVLLKGSGYLCSIHLDALPFKRVRRLLLEVFLDYGFAMLPFGQASFQLLVFLNLKIGQLLARVEASLCVNGTVVQALDVVSMQPLRDLLRVVPCLHFLHLHLLSLLLGHAIFVYHIDDSLLPVVVLRLFLLLILSGRPASDLHLSARG